MAASRVPQPDDSSARVAASPAGGHAQTARLLDGLPVPRRPGLPVPLSSLVGRQREIAEVVALFQASEVRLATLTGPGGIGKTRLALAAAEQLRADFPDGVSFVSLASVADPALVIPTLARTIGIFESVEQPILERLIDYLRERRMLLVIDNLEHVITAVADIARLLVACPAVRVLATSRESLRLQGEHEYPVPPLALPDAPRGPAGGTPQTSEAVELFVERARQAFPGFEPGGRNASTIVEICRRLDGMPLALELAAARIKVLAPDDLLARLDRPLALLSDGPRDAPARQRTMHDALQWSYDLLAPEEQRLFRCLAVFAGGCTLDAVEAVAESPDVLTTLTSLVDKSLLRRVVQPGRPTRYDMLEPIRQFAWELLTGDEQEAIRARQRHADYYCASFAGVRRGFDGPEGPRALDRVEADHANLMTALTWLRARDQTEAGLNLIHELGIFWIQRCHIDEGLVHANAFLNAPDGGHGTLARARALYPACWLWLIRGEFTTALAMIEEAGAIAGQHGDDETLAHALLIEGICRRVDDDQDERARTCWDRARTCWDRALEIFRAHGEDHMVVRTLFNLAHLSRLQGDLKQARVYAEEAVARSRAGNFTMVGASALGALGSIEERCGNVQRAAQLYRERLELYRTLDIQKGIADSLSQAARLVHMQGDVERAVCLYGAAILARDQSGSIWMGLPDLPEVDREIALLRAKLPEAAFQAAWERGQRMSMADAIDFGLASLCAFHGTERQAARISDLTRRESEVLALVARDMSNREIAAELFISTRTVERHIENLYRKLDIHSRAEAVAFGRRHLTD